MKESLSSAGGPTSPTTGGRSKQI